MFRGQSSSVIHTDISNLGNDLLDFTSGDFRRKYFSKINDKYSGGGGKLPSPSIIHSNDPDCITVQSFRHASSSGHIFRLIQCFVKTEFYKSDGDCENVEISFWTLAKGDVPVTIDTTTINNMTIIDDSYSERGNFKLSTQPHSQTSIIFNIEIAFNAELHPLTPIAIYKKLLSALEVVQSANVYYDRSEKVDEAVSNHFITEIMPNAKGLSEGEAKLIETSMTYIDKSFIRIPGTLTKDSSIEMFHMLSANDSAWGKGVGVVDTSAKKCLSWIMNWCSNERLAEHVAKNGNVLRVAHRIPDSHSQIVSAVMKLPAGAADRVFHGWFVWSKIPNYHGHEAFVLAFAPREECDASLLPPLPSFPNASRAIVGETKGIYLFETLAPEVTRMSLYQQASMEGDIPQFVINALVSKSLNTVQRVVDRFKRNGKAVDQEMRDAFVARIPDVSKLLSSSQQLVIDRCLEVADIGSGEFTELKSDSHRIKYFQRYDRCVARDSNVAIGKAVTEVDASAEDVLAWRWAWVSNEKIEIHREDPKSDKRYIVKEISGNEAIVSTTKRFPFPFKKRLFNITTVWSGPDADGVFLYCWETFEGNLPGVAASNSSSAVKADSRGLVRISPLSNGRIEFIIVQRINPFGNIPSWVSNMKIRDSLSTPAELHKAFDRDEEVDREALDEVIGLMKNYKDEDYSDKEEISIAKIRKLSEEADKMLVTIDSPSQFISMKAAAIEGKRNNTGYAELVLDGFLEECAAVEYMTFTRKRYNEFYGNAGGLLRNILKDGNHSHVLRSVYGK